MVRLSISRRRSPASVNRRKMLSSVRTLVNGSSGERISRLAISTSCCSEPRLEALFERGIFLREVFSAKVISVTSGRSSSRRTAIRWISRVPTLHEAGDSEVCVESSGVFGPAKISLRDLPKTSAPPSRARALTAWFLMRPSRSNFARTRSSLRKAGSEPVFAVASQRTNSWGSVGAVAGEKFLRSKQNLVWIVRPAGP